MSPDVSNHRLGAYIYGFLSGLGLALLMWGVASISWSPLRNATGYIVITFIGAFLLAFGGCREAYLRGRLSAAKASTTVKRKEITAETETEELILLEPEAHNQT